VLGNGSCADDHALRFLAGGALPGTDQRC
jgi:hypothetical protein